MAEKITDLGIEMYGKSDLRFVEAMYKVSIVQRNFTLVSIKLKNKQNGNKQQKSLMH